MNSHYIARLAVPLVEVLGTYAGSWASCFA